MDGGNKSSAKTYLPENAKPTWLRNQLIITHEKIFASIVFIFVEYSVQARTHHRSDSLNFVPGRTLFCWHHRCNADGTNVSRMKNLHYLLLIALLITGKHATGQVAGMPTDPALIAKSIREADSIFWIAYNACDVEKMASMFTDDLEFYHDKGGMTTSRTDFVKSIKEGLCGSTEWRLRREVMEGSVQIFPMNGYGALISGEHVFYVNQTGKKEYLDGYGKFMHLWMYSDGLWKMSRVLSYDHKAPPYINKRKAVTVPGALLTAYAGKYLSSRAGEIAFTVSGNNLTLETGNSKMEVYPESDSIFFSRERDIQFEFIKLNDNVLKVIVYEKGVIVETAPRIE